ncbi:MAG: outer membrane lipoprotein-sorting protein [Chitinivibrionales bacterium]|nr:outer membrane lipoprotein-sorting protein [Chitinivibrionales bacterium]
MIHKILFTMLLGAALLPAITIDEILDKMEQNENPQTSRSEITQVVVGADGRESVSKLVSYSAGKGEKGIMEYVEPARIRGMKILQLNDGDDIWFYSPRTARVRKIASHQKKQSVNNSDFSYEDLSTKDRREDYACKLAGEEENSGVQCYKIEMTAKSSDKVYSKMIFWVNKVTFVATQGHFFDENGELWKKLSIKDVTKAGKYWTPQSVEMHNVQKGSTTIMKMEKIENDIELDENMFGERNLRK